MKPFFSFGALSNRFGKAIGKALERNMLDALGGSEGFKKRYVINADGSKTMLETKNGMPRFTTVEDPIAGGEA